MPDQNSTMVSVNQARKLHTLVTKAIEFYQKLVADPKKAHEVRIALSNVEHALRTAGQNTTHVELGKCPGFSIAIDLFLWCSSMADLQREPGFDLNALETLQSKLK